MTAIAQVTTSTVITADKYNEIQSRIAGVIVNDYGYTAQSYSISPGKSIGAYEWGILEYDIDRCKIHQTNAETIGTVLSLVPTAANTNALIRGANESFDNRYTLHPAQSTSTVNTTSSPAGQWVSNQSVFKHVWASKADAKQFFALGGTIAASLTTNISTGLGKLITDADTELADTAYAMADYLRRVKIWTSRISDQGAVTVKSILTELGNQVTVTTTVTASAPESKTVTLDLGTTVTTRWSRDLGGNVPGFAAQPPSIAVNNGITSPVRSLTVSPSILNDFVWRAGSSSPAQQITLINTGNTEIQIYNILYSNAGGVVVLPAYGWAGSSPTVTIPINESRTFNLIYTGTLQGGPYLNTVTIKSNNDKGDIVIDTIQRTSLPQLTMSLNPESTAYSLTTPSTVSGQYLIVANRTATPSYSIDLEGDTDKFSITSPPGANPITVRFAAPIDTVNGSYAVTLTVTASADGNDSVTRSATMAVNYNLPIIVTANLSSWISPLAQANSVVGMSYDLVANTPVLTIGIGALADIANPPANLSPDANADATNLGITADVGYSETAGPALYRMWQYPGHIQFLKDYGVWIRQYLGDSASVEPINSYVTRSYTFTVAESKIYSWNFSVDDYGYFTIDGVIQGNMNTRYRNSRYWDRTQNGSLYLASGTHNITFVVINDIYQAGIAIRLYDPAQPATPDYDIWSTLKPIRAVPPYLYWNQVFRIPMSGSAATYQLTRNYCVKDTGPISWSDYFNPFITITDNGANRLDITFNQQSGNSNPTIIALPYSPYYFVNSEDPAVGVRVANADGGAVNGVPGQTNFFTGFSVVRAGGVIQSAAPSTRLVQPYPGYGYVAPIQDPYVYDPGPGGGADAGTGPL